MTLKWNFQNDKYSWSESTTKRIIWESLSSQLTVQSSEQDAMILSLNGFHLTSNTGPRCPVTRLAFMSTFPVCKREFRLNYTDEDLPAVKWRIIITQINYFINWQYDECSSTSNFGHNGDKFRISCAKIWVVRISRYGYIVVTVLSFSRTAIDMSKFRTSNSSK